jgi:FeS assembly SUF system protein
MTPMDTKPKRIPLDTMNLTPPPTPAPVTETPTPAATNPSAGLDPEQVRELQEQIVTQLCTCFDPEIPVNIYELGLIYQIDVRPDGAVDIKMTLTSPACPAAGSLPGEVKSKVLGVPGVAAAAVDVVWDPPWDKDRMSEAAKLQLGLFD